MSERWRTERICFDDSQLMIMEGNRVLTGGMRREIAEEIVAAVNAARADDRRGLAAEVERLQNALERVAAEFHFQHVMAAGVSVGDTKIPGMMECPQKFCAIASAALSGGSAAPDGGS